MIYSIHEFTLGGLVLFFCSLLVIICGTAYVCSSNNSMMSSKLKGYTAVVLNSIHGLYRRSPFVHAMGRFLADRKQPKHVPHLENFEKVSDRAYRVLGLNPGTHTLQGTNTWLITAGKESSLACHVLIDTGEDITALKYVEFLFEKVFPATGTKRLEKILLTHGHGDHQGGVIAILRELSARKMLPLPIVYKRHFDGGKEDFPARGFVVETIENGQVFTIGEETTIRAVYTPGHTDDHVSFILEEDNALISGDCVLGCGTTVFDDLHSYMQSLQLLRQLIVDRTIQRSNFERNISHPINKKQQQQPQTQVVDYHDSDDDVDAVVLNEVHTIYPGHGPVIRNTALQKIDEYINHRMQRESQILRALQRKEKKQHKEERQQQQEWLSSWELVDLVYGKLPMFVRVSAQWNVLHHLDKLKKENRVETHWPDLWKYRSNDDDK